MLNVTITSPAIREMKGVGKTSGKPYHMGFQTAWIHTFEKDGTPMPFPEKVEIILDKAEDGAFLFHPAGKYQLHPSSIYVDQNGGLAVAPRLVPVKV
jgi:hypothetical protein